jgi:para-aminobenzoate synthetase component 1
MLDSHAHVNPNHHFGYRDYDFVIAAGVKTTIDSNQNSLSDIDTAFKTDPEWLFGFFSYDLKNSIEKLRSDNRDFLHWPDFYFFSPKHLILANGNKVELITSTDNTSEIITEINNTDLIREAGFNTSSVKPKMSRTEYLNAVEKLRKHILRGDIYEVNFCQEFYANTTINPFESYHQLNTISPTPFSSFFRLNDKYLISASPERFIKKRGSELISQPIKGTAKRGSTIKEDKDIQSGLYNDPKERAENIMIVDLVRNDLSRIASPGTVSVDELCGIYSFSHVHQMISTISANLNTDSIEKIIRATFPMGSMTGAPKIRAMELAERYETTKRGLYSGAVGYISPDKDFDFNVVIRSLQYNQTNKYLSYMVGGAITWLSDAEKEYDECLLKAEAIERLLKG